MREKGQGKPSVFDPVIPCEDDGDWVVTEIDGCAFEIGDKLLLDDGSFLILEDASMATIAGFAWRFALEAAGEYVEDADLESTTAQQIGFEITHLDPSIAQPCDECGGSGEPQYPDPHTLIFGNCEKCKGTGNAAANQKEGNQ